MFGPTPIVILSQNTKRDSGRKVHLENINAGKTIADVIRTCLGPQAMLKMLMDPMGGIVMTNDGNAILREISVNHPAAKTLIEIARTQDEEVGDGTTSVIVLAGEVLGVAEAFFTQHMHPTVIIRAYRQALEDIISILDSKISLKLDTNDQAKLVEVVKACIGTKFMGRWSDLACKIALDAVKTVMVEEDDKREIDIKLYARIEKVPGGSLEDSYVLDGIMINKDVTFPTMRRYIENPRILLLDCNLEYKKAESQTNIEMMNEGDFTRLLEIEEEYIKDICAKIIAVKPDIVFTEKGISDLAQHYLGQANITAIRRLRKTDNNRLARACGATIVNRPDEIKEEDIGTGAGLFEVKKLGDEYFTFITKCKDPKACTILLRGPSKDILNEADRNLQDALHVAKNILIDPRLVLGGGAVEMAVSQALLEKSKSITGIEKGPYRAVAQALEVIPRTLAQNCGANIIRTLTALRAHHASGQSNMGINGTTGEITDVLKIGIYEPLSVKLQVYKTAIETAIMLLRIDDIVSGTKKKHEQNVPQPTRGQTNPTEESMRE